MFTTVGDSMGYLSDDVYALSDVSTNCISIEMMLFL